jgi:hypothetical protein
VDEEKSLTVNGTFQAVTRIGRYTFRNEIEADENSLWRATARLKNARRAETKARDGNRKWIALSPESFRVESDLDGNYYRVTFRPDAPQIGSAQPDG